MKKILAALAICLMPAANIFAQETLKINWPEEYKWKTGSDQENTSMHMVEMVPGNETIDRWTIIATTITVKGARHVPVDTAMNMLYRQARSNSEKARLTLVEKNDTARHPYIIFKIESPSFTDSPQPESQLYYIIAGDAATYTNFVAIKQAHLPANFTDRWTKIFRESTLVQ